MLKNFFTVSELVYLLLAVYVALHFILIQELYLNVGGLHIHSAVAFVIALLNAWSVTWLYKQIQNKNS